MERRQKVAYMIMIYLLLSQGAGPWNTVQQQYQYRNQYIQTGHIEHEYVINQDPRFPSDPENPFAGNQKLRTRQQMY